MRTISSETIAQMAEETGIPVNYLKKVLGVSKEEKENADISANIKKYKTELAVCTDPSQGKILRKTLETLCLKIVEAANTLKKIKEAWLETEEGSVSERICLLKWLQLVENDDQKKEVSSYVWKDQILEEALNFI